MKCYLCPNMCGVDRAAERGKCLAGEKAVVNRAALHFYEEPPISGTRGSGTVFFGGCVMRCEFCQNYEISRVPVGREYTPAELTELYQRLEREGVHNINLVTPTQWSREIRASFDIYRPAVPVVYNTSGYERKEIIRGMCDYVDVFLPDFKYSDEALARKLSLRADYPRIALDAIEEMLKAKPALYEDGLIKRGVIIRHLVLPGFIQNSIAALDMLAERFGKDITVSLMSQFTPVTGKTITRRLKPIEYKAVVAHAEKLGMEDVYIQTADSASEEFIPKWEK